ncbi:1-phosphofructokinase family hexose kinase [Cytophagaceae bacterium YF14B1]|uniref:1-phosphofructokinase family hexose kinase n=1 Tax=Xanthocytophaga flava TaxID=3048013 RepID=A0AAE3QNI1_9BACT|nr:1-phosphofructokinase family hexose kinase [Xanthocytophaga flavus]MDJ1482325.1 1-phosphofructokinase family hexose kinase [Xanthocytophaga flavus]
MGIVTLTLNPAIDKSTSIDRLVPEHKLRCENPKFEAGGGGINVSKAIHKLGGESLAIFPAGGPTGTLLIDLLQEDKITCKAVPTEQWTRENFIVVEHSTNAQYRFGMPGPQLSEIEAQACLEAIKAAHPDYLVASGSLPPGLPTDFYARVAKLAKEINARLILDTSGEPLKLAANEGVFLLKPNVGELSKMVGVETLETDDVDDAAKEIINRGDCGIVVVSMGPAGALLVTKDGHEHIPAPTVLKKSTVGAGDSMVAGMTWSLANGKTPQEMVRMGVACGSAATMNSGTQLFKMEDVRKLYDWICTYSTRYTHPNI